MNIIRRNQLRVPRIGRAIFASDLTLLVIRLVRVRSRLGWWAKEVDTPGT